MAQYYPYAIVTTMVDGIPRYSRLETGSFNCPTELRDALQYTIDAQQLALFNLYQDEQQREQYFFLSNLRIGKTLRVKAGRKLAKGLIGRCFWFGQTKYGHSVGIEVNGEKLFTSMGNVEVIL